jgi:hypothetical protein
MNPLRKFIELIERNEWVFAKTMPEIFHYYIVRDNLSLEYQRLFDEFALFIKEYGYSKKFYAKEYQYLDLEGYKYWFIENILNREKII